MPTDRPTLEELRAVTQPESTMNRRNAEHWLARLFLRKVSLRVTRLLIRTPVSANPSPADDRGRPGRRRGRRPVPGWLGAVARLRR